MFYERDLPATGGWFTNLKIVVAFEKGARLQVTGVELHGLRAGITVEPKEDVVLNVVATDVGRLMNNVREFDVSEVFHVLLRKQPARKAKEEKVRSKTLG